MTTRYFIGVDPGQAADPTAVAIVSAELGARPVLRCGYLARFPLGIRYPEMCWRVGRLADRFRGNCEIIVDETGVGRAVANIFEEQQVFITCVTITAGYGPEEKKDSRHFNIPKLQLVSQLQALLHDQRLKIQKNLPDVPALLEEFSSFQQKVTDSGRWTFGARSGAHDDLVLALALACWAGAKSDLNVWVAGGRDERDPPPPAELAFDEVQVKLRQPVWVASRNQMLSAGWQVLKAHEAAALADFIGPSRADANLWYAIHRRR